MWEGKGKGGEGRGGGFVDGVRMFSYASMCEFMVLDKLIENNTATI